jgi:hypothetical protein
VGFSFLFSLLQLCCTLQPPPAGPDIYPRSPGIPAMEFGGLKQVCRCLGSMIRWLDSAIGCRLSLTQSLMENGTPVSLPAQPTVTGLSPRNGRSKATAAFCCLDVLSRAGSKYASASNPHRLKAKASTKLYPVPTPVLYVPFPGPAQAARYPASSLCRSRTCLPYSPS